MTTPFYEADALERVAINLFYGWGYNFYRAENQLRADDLLVRAKVGDLLAQARAAVEAAELDYRHTHLPPPSREKPLPDPAAVRDAQRLEGMSRALGAIEGQIRALPAPETDRVTQRFRAEAATLKALVDADTELVGAAELLRSFVASASAAQMLGATARVDDGLAALRATVQRRRDILAHPSSAPAPLWTV